MYPVDVLLVFLYWLECQSLFLLEAHVFVDYVNCLLQPLLKSSLPSINQVLRLHLFRALKVILKDDKWFDWLLIEAIMFLVSFHKLLVQLGLPSYLADGLCYLCKVLLGLLEHIVSHSDTIRRGRATAAVWVTFVATGFNIPCIVISYFKGLSTVLDDATVALNDLRVLVCPLNQGLVWIEAFSYPVLE